MSSSFKSILADYLTREQLAKQLGVCERTLWLWERAGAGPPISHVGSKPYYHFDAVRSWLKARQKPMALRRRKAA